MTAPVTRRPGRPRSEQAEQAILDAAVDLLGSAGYSGFTVETVAARAGVAKSTVYRRWPGKDELIFDAINAVKGPVVEPPGRSVRADLIFLMDRLNVSLSGQHGLILQRLTGDGSDRPDIYRSFYDRLILPRRAVTHRVLRRGIAEGLIRADADVALVAEMLAAPLLITALTHRDRLTRKQVETVVDTVLAGIAA